MLEHTMWLKNRQADKYWTVVAQRYERDHVNSEDDNDVLWFEKLHMTSVLAPVVAAENLLADHHHLTTDAFENAVASGGEQTGMHVGKNVTIEPFVIRDAKSNRLDIINDFVQFYDLRLNAGTYVAVDSACEDVDVVRIVNDERHQEISVSTRFLRNYLAHKEYALVRQHDNFVRLKRKSSGLAIKYVPERAVSGPGHVFCLEVDWSDDLAKSRLIGKDLVMPFRERLDLLVPQIGHCEFVVGIDDQGREVTAAYRDGDETCDAASRSRMGGLCGRPTMYFGEDVCKYCFPVCFRRDVLKKYLESDRHKVDHGKVWCEQWIVAANIHDSGIVRVRLGDLTRLPACEQHYWRSYNVPPEGIGGRQYGGFGSTWVYWHGVGYGVDDFWKSFNNFQEMFERRFGFRLFKPLSEGDAYKEDSIRVPLNDEMGEFEGQIQYLAILLPDSIDGEQLLKIVNVERKGSKEPGSIEILEVFLKHKSLPVDIISRLRRIQNLRSSGVAHRKGSKYAKHVSDYNLDKTSKKEFIRKLIVDMTRDLTTLSELLERRHGQ